MGVSWSQAEPSHFEVKDIVLVRKALRMKDAD
ncbi:hypothetical protein CT19425_U600037 [Cupriavidus taiwanensis]|uniref:Uncharacterized protein n=1 Tax=Cupriavidus taiwanensis TaxID=164546 RepID=A0A375I6U6_9BURK|nr:hypothetical protein CT19425_U600037 [Cupriavidus taiwanensis]